MLMKFGLLIDVDLWKRVTSSTKYETGSSASMETPQSPSWNCIWCHYSTAGDLILTKFGNLIQNSTQHCDPIKIEKGRRIPIWRTFVFTNGSSHISTKFGLLTDDEW